MYQPLLPPFPSLLAPLPILSCFFCFVVYIYRSHVAPSLQSCPLPLYFLLLTAFPFSTPSLTPPTPYRRQPSPLFHERAVPAALPPALHLARATASSEPLRSTRKIAITASCVAAGQVVLPPARLPTANHHVPRPRATASHGQPLPPATSVPRKRRATASQTPSQCTRLTALAAVAAAANPAVSVATARHSVPHLRLRLRPVDRIGQRLLARRGQRHAHPSAPQCAAVRAKTTPSLSTTLTATAARHVPVFWQ